MSIARYLSFVPRYELLLPVLDLLAPGILPLTKGVEVVKVIRVNDVFGQYPRPKGKRHAYWEKWEDPLTTIPLEQICLKDMEEAMLHVFPTNRWSINVFRYLLPKALELSFFDMDDYKLFNPMDGDHQEILESTILRCCEWKDNLKAEEIKILDEVFIFAMQNYFSFNSEISPFYFCLFHSWPRPSSHARVATLWS